MQCTCARRRLTLCHSCFQVCGSFPALRSIDLTDCDRVTDKSLLLLSKYRREGEGEVEQEPGAAEGPFETSVGPGSASGVASPTMRAQGNTGGLRFSASFRVALASAETGAEAETDAAFAEVVPSSRKLREKAFSLFSEAPAEAASSSSEAAAEAAAAAQAALPSASVHLPRTNLARAQQAAHEAAMRGDASSSASARPTKAPRGLESIAIAGCSKVKDAGIRALLAGPATRDSLARLDVSRTAATASSLSKLPPTGALRELQAVGCKSLVKVCSCTAVRCQMTPPVPALLCSCQLRCLVNRHASPFLCSFPLSPL